MIENNDDMIFGTKIVCVCHLNEPECKLTYTKKVIS
jgi:hypothetical protein